MTCLLRGAGGDNFGIQACPPSKTLPLSSHPQEAYCAYTIIVMALFWCVEALPLAVTALFPLILFPMMGIMDASEVSLPIRPREEGFPGREGSTLGCCS